MTAVAAVSSVRPTPGTPAPAKPREAAAPKAPTMAADSLQTTATQSRLAPAPASLNARWKALDGGHRLVLKMTAGTVAAGVALGIAAAYGARTTLPVLKGIGAGVASGILAPTLLMRGAPIEAVAALLKRH